MQFTLEQLADFICEFIKDGHAPRSERDVVQWFKWFERKCGRRASLIRMFGRRPTYPGQEYFHAKCPEIRRAEENWEKKHYG